MGFDLNGLKPKGTKIPRPKSPPYTKIKKGTYSYNQKDMEEYHEKLEEWSNQEGTYFRNNCWWWRPLADYTLNYTKVLELNEKTMEGWHHNSGHKVSKANAEQIAKQLKFLIDSGHTKKFEEKYMAEHHKARKYNETITEKMQKLNNLKRNKDLAPINFSKKDKKEWDRLYKMQLSIASYPFSVENVKAFMKFCNSSGGFEIC